MNVFYIALLPRAYARTWFIRNAHAHYGAIIIGKVRSHVHAVVKLFVINALLVNLKFTPNSHVHASGLNV